MIVRDAGSSWHVVLQTDHAERDVESGEAAAGDYEITPLAPWVFVATTDADRAACPSLR